MLRCVAQVSLAAALVGAVFTLPSVAAAAVALPPANGQLDYQIGGAYVPDPAVRIVDRDRTVAPVPGKYNVCYLNAFQTQPDAARWWKAHHKTLLLRRRGAYVVDSAWNEILLDTSRPRKRAALASIIGNWIDACRRAGYQAIEPDNLDSWTRSRRLLTRSQDTALASQLIARAHRAGLAIAQKNTPELGSAGKAMGFDFAIAEECFVYDECGAYTQAYGHQVFEVEYADNGGRRNYAAACRAHGAAISIVYRDRQVVARGRSGYAYAAC